jgi:DNA-binding transcriptional LysR family regulator
MNFQQLRYVRAAVNNDLNLTKVASQVFTSQSGVSKQIKELEAQLQIEIFVRRGKRLTSLTEAGRAVVEVIERLLQEADNLRKISEQYAEADRGRLVIATTHNQANYVLPQMLLQFSRDFPKVDVELRQRAAGEIVETLLRGEADIGIATEAMDGHPELFTVPCFTWRHLVVVHPDHPLAGRQNVTLEEIAAFPIITYMTGYTGRSKIDASFAAAGLEPDIRLAAADADVIKTYVRLGMGIGIVAEMAVAGETDRSLVKLAGSEQLFAPCSTKLAFPAGALLRNYIYRLIEAIAPHTSEKALRNTAKGLAPEPLAAVLPYNERTDLRWPPRVDRPTQPQKEAA